MTIVKGDFSDAPNKPPTDSVVAWAVSSMLRAIFSSSL